jgi:hypothetical protein
MYNKMYINDKLNYTEVKNETNVQVVNKKKSGCSRRHVCMHACIIYYYYHYCTEYVVEKKFHFLFWLIMILQCHGET